MIQPRQKLQELSFVIRRLTPEQPLHSRRRRAQSTCGAWLQHGRIHDVDVAQTVVRRSNPLLQLIEGERTG